MDDSATNEAETVAKDKEQLDHLEEEIEQARHHLDDETHQEEDRPEFYEDDQADDEVDDQAEHEAPGNDNPPA
ncbi:MAG: hypothetical protein QOK39_1670 [Acidimicrobiaceae bacterium]|jgi:hypothetical protein|nr:hypothetical protein [Acidimicrobiaceae bacterium]